MRNMSTSYTSDTTSLGVAAVREVAEDARAESAVKEGSVGPHSFIRNKWQV